MTKHKLPFTYGTKIRFILTGDCTQTIRAGSKFSVGDEILIYSWSSKPYSKRSAWINRTDVVVTSVIPIIVSEVGIKFPLAYDDHIFSWTHEMINDLAKLDFIDPPTGLALRDVLIDLLKLPKGEESDCQIIRWVFKE